MNAKKVLKKRYESDEEDKAPEVVTTMPPEIALSADDSIMPRGYVEAYNKALAKITDEEERSKRFLRVMA